MNDGFADLLAGKRHGPRYSRSARDDRSLENAIEALQEQLQFANMSLTDERQRVDDLLHQLADARTALANAQYYVTWLMRLEGQPMGKVRWMYADNKYHNYVLYEWVETNADWELAIVRKPEGSEGWVKLPIRWTVERTFAWLGRYRRHSRDYERRSASSEAMIKISMIHRMARRLQPGPKTVRFHYRTKRRKKAS